MWAIAIALLSVATLATLAGFHLGPHAHAVAGAAGILTAAWLVAMAATGLSSPMLFTLLTADLLLSGTVTTLAVKGLSNRFQPALGRGNHTIEGAEGVAESDLEPDGMVRVRGESWSATALNGPVRKGTMIQVIKAGVRLEVWGETPLVEDALPPAPVSAIDARPSDNSNQKDV
jgi:membrane-bound ClpP family serine protease